MNAAAVKEIVGQTRLDDAELEATAAYFLRATRGKMTPAYYPILREAIRQRENELFGAAKFESAMYGAPTRHRNDSNEQGEL